MKITKKQAIAVLAVALTVAGAGINSVYAESESSNKSNPMNGLISAIAAKFNLDASEVRRVFDDQRTKMQAQRQQDFADRLAQAVAAGNLTQKQADAITAKRADMKELKNKIEGLTGEERRAAMREQMGSMKKWAKDNNIPGEYVKMGDRGMGGRPGPKMGISGDCPTDNEGVGESGQ